MLFTIAMNTDKRVYIEEQKPDGRMVTYPGTITRFTTGDVVFTDGKHETISGYEVKFSRGMMQKPVYFFHKNRQVGNRVKHGRPYLLYNPASAIDSDWVYGMPGADAVEYNALVESQVIYQANRAISGKAQALSGLMAIIIGVVIGLGGYFVYDEYIGPELAKQQQEQPAKYLPVPK